MASGIAGGKPRLPVIGIPLHARAGEDPHSVRYSEQQSEAYFDAVRKAGGLPVGIPVTDDIALLRQAFDMCDGILLGGGRDIAPSAYHHAELKEAGIESEVPAVDRAEIQLARWAMKEDVPLLAICRGQQVLNVACGGTLWQDVNIQGATTVNHRVRDYNALVHDIRVVPGTTLRTIVHLRRLRVNSLHHQAIRDLGSGLRVTAWADDGLIEGVEAPGKRFVIGVQSHPESLQQFHWARQMFSAFVDAARVSANQKKLVGQPAVPPRHFLGLRPFSHSRQLA